MWRTERQLFSDLLDQLDFALDQLFVRDRNHDRFSVMLVDNVVELAMHHYAESVSTRRRLGLGKDLEPEIVRKATGRHFDAKVKLAKATGLVSQTLGDSIAELHEYRNSAHHGGRRHERILNPMGAFYLQCACDILASDELKLWGFSASSADIVSRRAQRYIANPNSTSDLTTDWGSVWKRVRLIVEPLAAELVASLAADAIVMVDATDEALRFLSEDGFNKPTRDQVVVDAQVAALWPLPETQERLQSLPSQLTANWTVSDALDWLRENAEIVRNDPVSGWRQRCERIAQETDRHLALKKYADFKKQTQSLRTGIHESAVGLDAAIQHQIDVARGK